VIKAELKAQGFWASARGNEARTKREVRAALAEGCGAAIKLWWQQFLPMHFLTSAVAKYGYQKRTRDYMITKARVKGHQNPLVWSGTMQRMLTGGITIKPLGSGPPGAKGTMTGPRWMGWRRWAAQGGRGMGSPDMKKELTTIAPAELAVLREVVKRVGMERLRQIRGWFQKVIA
jgi:hypothetical protein